MRVGWEQRCERGLLTLAAERGIHTLAAARGALTLAAERGVHTLAAECGEHTPAAERGVHSLAAERLDGGIGRGARDRGSMDCHGWGLREALATRGRPPPSGGVGYTRVR